MDRMNIERREVTESSRSAQARLTTMRLRACLVALTGMLVAVSANAAVGRTSGSFAVSQDGSANYVIPIWTPPGPNGMQPKVTLAYNSNGGIGATGIGWALSGLSSIGRCNRTVAQDGMAAAVALNYGDVFCLDGRRLRLTSSQNLSSYGQPGTTYQTEIATFENVTAIGAVGGGPESFTVQSRDGMTYYYGSTSAANSRVMASSGGTAVAWLLDKVSDKSGNTWKVEYNSPASNPALVGATNPKRISWAPTSHGSASYLYTMEFVYGQNNAATSPTGNVASTSLLNAELLSRIEIRNSSGLIRLYSLEYEASNVTGRNRLKKLTECDGSVTNCLSPTIMSYQDGSKGLATASAVPSTLATVPVCDLNGDGRDDLLQSAGVGQPLYAYFGANGGVSSSAINTGLTGYSIIGCRDLSGTGKDSLLVNVGGMLRVISWNGSAFSTSTTTVANPSGQSILADTDADGLPDLVTLQSTSIASTFQVIVAKNTSVAGALNFASAGAPVVFSVTPGFGPYLSARRWHTDFNGDGREDLALVVQAGSPYMLPAIASGTTFVVGPPVQGNITDFFDWNDDGCTDLGIWSSTAMYIATSQCTGSNWQIVQLSGAGANDRFAGALDWDGDGRTDAAVVKSGTGEVMLYQSTGAAVSAPVSGGFSIAEFESWQTGDFDGDGSRDVLYNASAPPYRYIALHNGAGVKPDLMTSIFDGYGAGTSFAYGPATWSSHTKSSDSVYPNSDYQGPRTIVKAATPTDGVGGTYTKTYTYAGAAIHLQGRGFSGFASQKVVDSRDGTYTLSSFSRTFPYTGMLTGRSTYQQNAALIETLSVTPARTDLSTYANSERVFVYESSRTSLAYELDGAWSLQSTESSTYDSWGNLFAHSITVTDRDQVSPQLNQSWTKAVSAAFAPDVGANWCLGLPTSTTETYSTSTGEPTVTLNKTYGVDYARCRPDQEISQPSSPNRRVLRVFGYDAFGNLNALSVTGRNNDGTDMATRQSTVDWGPTGRFPVSSTNALGHMTARTFNEAFGTVSTETDPNGLTTTWAPDSFGRVQSEVRPDGTSTTYVRDGAIPGIDPRVRERLAVYQLAAGGAALRQDHFYTDQLSRPILEYRQDLAGSFSTTSRGFDDRGRKIWEGIPFASTGGYQFTPAAKLTFEYDLLGRVVAERRPVSATNSSLQSVTTSYHGRTATTTDPQGKSSVKVSDAMGRLRRSQDHDGYYQSFGYDAFGSLTSASDALGNGLLSASYSYALAPIQDSIADMDIGTRTNTSNSLGEVVASTDAKGQTVSQTYDRLSRPQVRTEPEGQTTWTWGNSANDHNIGQLALVTSPGFSESYLYDSLGRVQRREINTDAQYWFDYEYNAAGLLEFVTYPTSTTPSRLRLQQLYQAGILNEVKDADTGAAYWKALAQNSRGQTIQELFGNGVLTVRSIDAVTGWENSIQSGIGGGATIQNESYLRDLVGNTIQRQNNNLGLTENFQYDNLYRLNYSTLQTQSGTTTNLDVDYDAMGNITARSDVANGATWTYHATKRHAVTQAGSSAHAYSYDANGNAITRGDQVIGWSSYNYPLSVSGGGKSLTFFYDANRSRYKQIYGSAAGTETTMYVGDLLEKNTVGGVTDWRHYVKVGSRTVAIVSRKSDGTNVTRYLLEDHLGSVAQIVDASGTPYVSESFAAFGARRDAGTWSDSCLCDDLVKIKGVSRRGFTEHEAVGGVSLGLIHMNGRMQDSITGRMLSPDSMVASVYNSQSWNRYSYVMNNPLSFTDPTGFVPTCIPDFGSFGDWNFGNRFAWMTKGPDGLAEVNLNTGREKGYSHGVLNCFEAPTGDYYQMFVPTLDGAPGGATPGGAPSTQEKPQGQKPINKCWNGSIGLSGTIQGPVVGPLGVGVSGNLLGGISYGGSLFDTRITTQGSIAGLLGGGLYGGFGVTAQGGSGATQGGFSGSITPHAEANLGMALSASVSTDFTSQGYQSIGGWVEHARFSRLGVGIGFAAGGGASANLSYGFPTIREVGNAVASRLGFNGELFGSPAGCK